MISVEIIDVDEDDFADGYDDFQDDNSFNGTKVTIMAPWSPRQH